MVQASQPAPRAAVKELLGELTSLEVELHPVHRRARLLLALTSRGAAGERDRLVQDLRAQRPLRPRWNPVAPVRATAELRAVDRLRRRVEPLPVAALYRDRLDELELELCMLEGFGKERCVRPLAARRYGTGALPAPGWTGGGRLSDLARRILTQLEPEVEPRTVRAQGGHPAAGLSGMMRGLIDRMALDADVVVDPQLVAGAATGDRTVYVADRRFGEREARRLLVHEVLGHLLAAANGRCQPLRILEWGTADSYADQEGVALCLEARCGAMDAQRLRMLAARVLATDLMHAGATFDDTARDLWERDGLTPEEAVVVAERAYRGGGVARDVVYLDGYLRVRQALIDGDTDLDELRAGRLSVSAIPMVRALRDIGLSRPAPQRPNFARSFWETRSGTKPSTLPPSDAASLMRLELT